VAKALKAAGARHVLLAGRAGDREAALRAAGVDGFIYVGCDMIEALGSLQSILGVSTTS
jgi:methylmalonyl-CoA mutase